jgi:Na+/H+ antiporter NhaD/arsenite permease-like protein
MGGKIVVVATDIGMPDLVLTRLLYVRRLKSNWMSLLALVIPGIVSQLERIERFFSWLAAIQVRFDYIKLL